MLKNIISLAILLAGTVPAARALTVDAARCVEMALSSSEDMAQARNSVEQAKLQRDVARTRWFPDFKGSATVGWMLPDSKMEDMAMTLQMRGVYMAGINLTQPVFAGGKIIAANKMAKIGREAAAQQQRLTELQVKSDAETSYWTYVAVLEKVEMMKSYKALVDTAYARTLTSVNAGMATRNDLLRVEARQSQVTYQLEQAQSGAELCRMALCTSIGVGDSTPIEPADSVIPEEIPADLGVFDLDMRPEMQLLDADIRVKRQQVNLTRGDYLPTLGLQAGWSAYGNMKINSMAQAPDGSYVPVSQNIHDNGFNIMLALQVPLFHWGEGVKKVKAAKVDVVNAELTRQHNRRMMNLEVRQAESNVRTGMKLVESARVALEQAKLSLEQTSTSYRVGMCTLTDLLDAQSQWHTSRANLIEARTQLRINIIDYQRATATL